MKEYHALTEDEIKKYKDMLKLPNIDFPHYEHLIIDGKIVYQYYEDNLLTNERFLENEYFKKNYNIKLEISNYGRVKKNGKYLEQWVGKGTIERPNTFKHGLFVYINSDWKEKPVHRLIKETFDPIFEMDKYEGKFKKYQVHHLNNNGNDNKLENLLWVTMEDHRRIDRDFNIKLIDIAKTINLKNNENNNAALILDIDSEES